MRNIATVVIPTLAADGKLDACLRSLAAQTLSAREIIVVDNSGSGKVRAGAGVKVLREDRNIGFGAAVNAAFRCSHAPYLATLNDDTVAHPRWLEALVCALERRPDAGMCASQVRLYGEARLDSCGMLVCADGSSKQRGHGRAPEDFPVEEEVLFPSGSAALYRRKMLEEIGLFDEDFFLYCEDTDLGLRARWFGWRCLYVPGAVVEHHYSHSAGRASPLKAYYVERNRLRVLARNFPAGMLPRALGASLARYAWHLFFLAVGRGSAARFREEGNPGIRLAYYVMKAHGALLLGLPRLWRERRSLRRRARLIPRVYRWLLRQHSITTRRVAEL